MLQTFFQCTFWSFIGDKKIDRYSEDKLVKADDKNNKRWLLNRMRNEEKKDKVLKISYPFLLTDFQMPPPYGIDGSI